MATSFVDKIKSGTIPIGTLVTLDSPEVAEILSACGYDWLFIDSEHSALDVTSTQRLIQATGNGCSSIVRIPENAPVWIKKVLDTGCDGIIVPQVNTKDDALAAVNAAKYPPVGSRSVGISRAHGYGASFGDYVQTANDTVALIIQIEHINAVDSIDEILTVTGIDGVLIGPYDLSGSMNLLGRVDHSDVQGAIDTIKKACVASSVPVGIFMMNPENVQHEIASGCSFIALGIDTTTLSTAAKEKLTMARK